MIKDKTTIRKYKPPRNGINGAELKLIAVIAMIIDHVAYSLVSLSPNISDHNSLVFMLYWAMRLIGRCAFPIYCFFLVEGFNYTKDKRKYALRLFVFALISELPFDLALHKQAIFFDHNNVFWTLLLGLLMIYAFDYIEKYKLKNTASNTKYMVIKRIFQVLGLLVPSAYFAYKIQRYILNSLVLVLWIIIIITMVLLLNNYAKRHGEQAALSLCAKLVVLTLSMFIADIFHTDYSSAGICTIAAMYLMRSSYYRRMVFGCAVLTALSNPTELASFITLPLILKYNGKRGHQIKYLFYLIYPVHLMILYIIAKLILLN